MLYRARRQRREITHGLLKTNRELQTRLPCSQSPSQSMRESVLFFFKAVILEELLKIELFMQIGYLIAIYVFDHYITITKELILMSHKLSFSTKHRLEVYLLLVVVFCLFLIFVFTMNTKKVNKREICHLYLYAKNHSNVSKTLSTLFNTDNI